MPRRQAKPPRAGTPGSVRVIGGRWRGTRLPVADVAGLRPTADRARETLFNWLAPKLPGARVLDLFAGSGALGFEAVSRGAASAVLVERDAALAGSLRESARRLGAGDAIEVVHGDALAWLADGGDGFDIVFVDPPFADGSWPRVLALLPPRLNAGAWLYLESPRDAVPAVPEPWLPHREGHTRDARHALYRRGPAAADTLHAMAPTRPETTDQ